MDFECLQFSIFLNRMFHLPREIVIKIFEFDPTYHEVQDAFLKELDILRRRKDMSNTRADLDRVLKLENRRIHPTWIQHRIDCVIKNMKQKIKQDRSNIKKNLMFFSGFRDLVNMHRLHQELIYIVQD